MARGKPGERRCSDVGRVALALALAAAAMIAATSGCHLVTPFRADGPADAGPTRDAESDGDVDGDADGDVEHDGDAGDGGEGFTGPGPLTFAVCDVVVTGERVFDLDGDGSLDDAIADLGEEQANVFALVLTPILQGALEAGKVRLLHFRWVGDRDTLNEPHATVLYLTGGDLLGEDDPLLREDDYSGEEHFWADYESLDPCGEPRDVFTRGALEDGVLQGEGESVAVPLDSGGHLPLQEIHVRGPVEPGGRAVSLEIAGALTIGHLGGELGPEQADGLSWLEVFLAGGGAFGIPTMSGLTPNLDLDGDGLESFVVDEDGRIASCIDGDRRVIEGRDCWQDEGMRDALALTMRWEGVSAFLDGRRPGWDTPDAGIEGECTDPPERSLFDPPPDAG